MYFSNSTMKPFQDLDHFGLLLFAGDLDSVKADFSDRVARVGADEAVTEICALRYGATKTPIYNVLLLASIIQPDLRKKHLEVARWLAQTARIPVDGRDLSGTTALCHALATQPSFDAELAEILYEAGGDVTARDRFGGTCGHGMAVIWDKSDRALVTKKVEAMKWWLSHGGNADVQDNDGMSVRVLVETTERTGINREMAGDDVALIALKLKLALVLAQPASAKVLLFRTSERVVGSTSNRIHPSKAVKAVIDLLDQLDHWIDEIPPLPTPQRFGNLAFRTWGKRLEDRADNLLCSLLPPSFHAVIPHLRPYLLISFGSFVRMDYGTGHETAFAMLLLCLTLIRFLRPDPEEERQVVLVLFVRYLTLSWRLQDVYKLEPAGSHGVWGLDDSHFLGYIFGSAQLRDQDAIPVASVLRPPLPPTNLYFMSIMRIHEVKHGPFHEHSSQLYSIATGVQHWAKVHSGLFKMYEAEVLGKRVVVQHIPLGGLIEWNVENAESIPDASADVSSVSSAPPYSRAGGTQAPWASATPRAYPLNLSVSGVTHAPWVDAPYPAARHVTPPASAKSTRGSNYGRMGPPPAPQP
ncbi:hypothetical protein EW146_g2111 [Bondarzewia mesenterica]|uniref:Serine/threonine-protein phosphatase 2A activator n=1 Tax=Bondarzewia mesenterica TaxID=1095465 RepID=A0A4S4M245_9AGAM|nr:hypothetical protein EW146_g2111 [Bondarzewia mesenterica]